MFPKYIGLRELSYRNKTQAKVCLNKIGFESSKEAKDIWHDLQLYMCPDISHDLQLYTMQLQWL